MLNKDKLNAVFDTVRAEWERLRTAIKATFNEWALILPSTGSSETYVWTELLVQIREWIGERVFGNIKAQNWTIVNRKFEGSFKVDVDEIEDNRLGTVPAKVQDLYAAATFHPEKLLEEVALAGFTTVCFDGQLFLDSDHPSLTGDGTTVSNVSTDPLDYDNARKAVNEFFPMIQGGTGVPLDIEVYAIMVGPSLLGTANSLFNDEKKPNSLTESNQLRGRAKPVLNRRFVGAYANYWIVMARFRGSSLTPFIYQERKTAELKSTMIEVGGGMAGADGQDFMQFMEDAVAFGTKHRGNATFTMWCLAYGSTGSGAA